MRGAPGQYGQDKLIESEKANNGRHGAGSYHNRPADELRLQASQECQVQPGLIKTWQRNVFTLAAVAADVFSGSTLFLFSQLSGPL